MSDARKAAEMAAQEYAEQFWLGEKPKSVGTIATLLMSFHEARLQASATRPAAGPDGQSEAVCEWPPTKEDTLLFALWRARNVIATYSERDTSMLGSAAGGALHLLDKQIARLRALTSPARARGEG